MRSVAVTGASGFIGGAMVKRLRASGYVVHAFGRRPFSQVDNGIGKAYRSWDITRGVLEKPPPVDAVVHCAAAVADWGRACVFERVNVTGVEHVLATWPEARFVHVSSSSIYDPDSDLSWTTEDAADPLDRESIDRIRWLGHYGRTKRLAERVVARARPDRAIILRPRVVYGPDDRTLLPKLLRRYRAGRLIVPGRPDTRLSVTHIDNFASAVETALRSSATGPFNVADEGSVRLGTLLEAALVAAGRVPRVVYLPIGPAWAFATVLEGVHLNGLLPPPVVTRFQIHNLSRDFVLDTSRARQELGWRPTMDTMDGIRSMCEGQRDLD